jgi:peptide/nickel transport system substrate-binding protein
VLHEIDPEKQHADMFHFVKHVMDTEAHNAWLLWWYRRVPMRSYVHGWKISPSHYMNQDLSTIWLAPPHCGECTTQPRPTG